MADGKRAPFWNGMRSPFLWSPKPWLLLPEPAAEFQLHQRFRSAS